MAQSSGKVELAWVTFAAPARLDSQSSTSPAVAKTPTTTIYKGTFDGSPVVFIEDESLRIPGVIPWENVASFGVHVPEAKAKAKDAA